MPNLTRMGAKSTEDTAAPRKRAEKVASRRGMLVDLGRSVALPPLQNTLVKEIQPPSENTAIVDACEYINTLDTMSAQQQQELERLRAAVALKLGTSPRLPDGAKP